MTTGPSSASGGMIALNRDPFGQPGVDHRRGLVDPAADPRDDPVDDLEQVLVVAEDDLRLLDPPLLLDDRRSWGR